MAGMPSSITHQQKLAAVRALGLDPTLVKTVALDATDGAAVTVFVRDLHGRLVVQGKDQAAEAVLTIPYSYADPDPMVDTATYSDPDAAIPGTRSTTPTGHRYYVTSRVGPHTVANREPLADPFVRHTVVIGWTDLLRGLLRRRLEVTVTIDGDRDAVDQVLNLPVPAGR